jgi:hypothetical protein
MKKDFASNTYPDWVNHIDKLKHCTCLSDDLDSLVTQAILSNIFGVEVGYFYNFNGLYINELEATTNKEMIGIDVALIANKIFTDHLKTFDNHVVLIRENGKPNPNSFNVNKHIYHGTYYQKFCVSTAAQLWSFFNRKMPKTEEGKMILLAIDSLFMGWFSNKFHDLHVEYMKKFEFEPLLDVLGRHPYQEFEDISKRYNLKSKIILNPDTGRLETDIKLDEVSQLLELDLSLPQTAFVQMLELVTVSLDYRFASDYNRLRDHALNKEIFSLAITKPGKVKCSVIA